ncbi:hypothetical protein DFS33DRAFT_24366 [Desarmillaria ectypa]|nr:hypothetical protein DFS33DRAFT_24366 [Desarmillaria ectypa]
MVDFFRPRHQQLPNTQLLTMSDASPVKGKPVPETSRPPSLRPSSPSCSRKRVSQASFAISHSPPTTDSDVERVCKRRKVLSSSPPSPTDSFASSDSLEEPLIFQTPCEFECDDDLAIAAILDEHAHIHIPAMSTPERAPVLQEGCSPWLKRAVSLSRRDDN